MNVPFQLENFELAYNSAHVTNTMNANFAPILITDNVHDWVLARPDHEVVKSSWWLGYKVSPNFEGHSC